MVRRTLQPSAVHTLCVSVDLLFTYTLNLSNGYAPIDISLADFMRLVSGSGVSACHHYIAASYVLSECAGG